MSQLTVLLIVLGCASAYLFQDFKYIQTTVPSGQHTSIDDSMRDLMTLIIEEKKLRFQLEARVNAAEDKINKIEQYNIAVSNELEKEKNKVEQLETMYYYYSVKRELDNITASNYECVGRHEFETVQSNMKNVTSDISLLKSGERRFHDETRRVNITLIDQISDMSRQLQMVNDCLDLDDRRKIVEETNKLNKTLSETVMNTEKLLQITNISLQTTRSEIVGFSVYKPDTYTGSGVHPLKFQAIVYNEHSVYNVTTGVFVCKHPGLYFFIHIVLRSPSNNYVYCYIFKNGQRISYSALTGPGDGYSSSANALLYHLQAGDRVYVSGCSHPEALSRETSFTGFLVSQGY